MWARHQIPHFSHDGVHWWSWQPLKRSLVWAKWFFVAKSAKGFSDPRTFWRDAPSKHPCQHCNRHHNQSVHGVIALCQWQQNPLLAAWATAWGTQKDAVTRWRESANQQDLRLTGKLLCPISLVGMLVETIGYSGARKAVKKFYDSVLPLFQNCLPQWTEEEKSGFKLRLDPYRAGGWETARSCIP